MDPAILKQKKRVRYTLILTPAELQLARDLAEKEFRTLPNFFRARIYHPATPIESLPQLNSNVSQGDKDAASHPSGN